MEDVNSEQTGSRFPALPPAQYRTLHLCFPLLSFSGCCLEPRQTLEGRQIMAKPINIVDNYTWVFTVDHPLLLGVFHNPHPDGPHFYPAGPLLPPPPPDLYDGVEYLVFPDQVQNLPTVLGPPHPQQKIFSTNSS